ncbi:MAG: LexA family transcriptional regulator [Cyclobacteriaceae bacterium]|nr:LexA family transcriptional regulator [Cyclobacteriaceae bacterium]
MPLISKNLKFLRGRQGLTQKQLAEKLKLNQPVIGAYEEGRALPPLPALQKLATLFQVSLDDLANTDLSKPGHLFKQASSSKEVLAITVDRTGRENVELVSQKAAAGYLNGYQDPEYISELPKIQLPVLPQNRTVRAFEIKGDSMLPVPSGSIVFGEYIEKIAQVKNGKAYVLVTQGEGIVFKRVFFLDNQPDKLLLVSDNKTYQPYFIALSDVREVWLARGCYASLAD